MTTIGRLDAGANLMSRRLCSALRVPPFQFDQHRSQQFVVGRAGDEGSFGDGADEYRHLAALEGPAEPLTKFGVGAGGEHPPDLAITGIAQGFGSPFASRG